jgi:hypothetical protein
MRAGAEEQAASVINSENAEMRQAMVAMVCLPGAINSMGDILPGGAQGRNSPFDYRLFLLLQQSHKPDFCLFGGG